jgi:hypothetical protein
MANICDYKMVVKGSKKSIQILKALLNGDMTQAKEFGYNGKKFPSINPTIIDDYKESKKQQLIIVEGSTESDTIFSSLIVDENKDEVSYDVLSEQLGLESEIWSLIISSHIVEHIVVGSSIEPLRYSIGEYREYYNWKTCETTIYPQDFFNFDKIEKSI